MNNLLLPRFLLLCFFLHSYGITKAKVNFDDPLFLAIDDNYTLYQGTTLEVPSSNNLSPSILANDGAPNDSLYLPISAPDTLLSTIDSNNTLILFPSGAFKYIPNNDFSGTDSFSYEVCLDDTPVLCDIGTIFFFITPCIPLELSVFLEGCYNPTTGEMDTKLNLKDGSLLHRGVLPGQEKLSINIPGISVTEPFQPYNTSPWNYNGQERIVSIPTSMVDWVLIMARDANGNILSQQAGFVNWFGQLRAVDGSAGIPLEDIEGNYLSIHHASHLAMLSAFPYTGQEMDFTANVSMAAGSNQLKLINGKYALISGDYDNSGVINSLDFNLWKTNGATLNQYMPMDGDGNGIINSLDFNLWARNRSKVGHPSLRN